MAGDEPPEVLLAPIGRAEAPGRLLELSAFRALVRFGLPGAPELAIGQSVALMLGRGSPRAVSTRAAVVLRQDRACSRCYGVQFAPPQRGAESRDVVEAIRRLLNRRDAFRVEPGPASRVRALVGETRDSAFEAEVLDISATGIGLRVGEAAEAGLTARLEVGVFLTLPSHAPVLHLPGTIRSREGIPSGVRYGVRFGPAADQAARDARDLVAAYVTALERESLRRHRSD